MSKRGILLINLGSPDSPHVADVKRYLREFLMDGRVIDCAWPLRFALVNFAIIPRRAHQSAEAYQMIWTAEGSPLVTTTRMVRDELQMRLAVPVEMAMRYQNPTIEDGIQNLAAQNVTELLVIPLFPQFAMSSFETAAKRAVQIAFEQAPWMKVKVAQPFFNDPNYIAALVDSARPFLNRPHDHLLFSFHGLPERHLRKADPTGQHCLAAERCCDASNPAHKTCYRAQCFDTVRAFVREAGLGDGSYSVAFQSRLGKEPWMKPYTDVELVRLAKAGVKRLFIICPAFVADCLETLEEIGLRGRAVFLENGGKEFTMIPCMNDHPRWIAALEKMANDFVATQDGAASPRAIPASERQIESVLTR